MHYKLEVVMLPVTDVDRAKSFYEKAGFHLDVDYQPSDTFRVVQLTPPGSACSISFGTGLTTAAPGSVKGTHLIVDDIEAAAAELAGRGIEVGDILHFDNGTPQPGPHPERADMGSFAEFSDPDDNTWVLQEVGHGTSAT